MVNGQQLPSDLSIEFGGYALCQNDFECNLTSTIKCRLPPCPFSVPSEGRGETLEVVVVGSYGNKSLFLVASKNWMSDWWDSVVSALQLTLPTAMETLSFLKQWRKCRPCKFSHVQVLGRGRTQKNFQYDPNRSKCDASVYFDPIKVGFDMHAMTDSRNTRCISSQLDPRTNSSHFERLSVKYV